jgi:hypothetical protein
VIVFARVFIVEGVTYIYWEFDQPSKVGFVMVFTIEGVIYIY